jgi:hypothetical protein
VTGSCLLEMVVRMRRLLCVGRRSWRRSCSCEIVVSAGSGRARVEGRLSPGKDVKRMLTVGEAILDRFSNLSSRKLKD